MNFKKNNIKYIAPLVIMVVFMLVLPIVSFAQGTPPCDPSKELCNPIKFNSIQCLFQAVLKIAAEIGSVFVVLGLIYSGFLFVMARGNEEQLTKAKRAITYTVIGAVIVLGAWAFSVGIANTVNSITNPGATAPTVTCP